MMFKWLQYKNINDSNNVNVNMFNMKFNDSTLQHLSLWIYRLYGPTINIQWLQQIIQSLQERELVWFKWENWMPIATNQMSCPFPLLLSLCQELTTHHLACICISLCLPLGVLHVLPLHPVPEAAYWEEDSVGWHQILYRLDIESEIYKPLSQALSSILATFACYSSELSDF